MPRENPFLFFLTLTLLITRNALQPSRKLTNPSNPLNIAPTASPAHLQPQPRPRIRQTWQTGYNAHHSDPSTSGPLVPVSNRATKKTIPQRMNQPQRPVPTVARPPRSADMNPPELRRTTRTLLKTFSRCYSSTKEDKSGYEDELGGCRRRRRRRRRRGCGWVGEELGGFPSNRGMGCYKGVGVDVGNWVER